jgi:nicotinate-nucleotide adenylyltransferase
MIGFMGGTFDPVHFGHLRVALEVMELVGLDCLRLLPCREPAHGSVPGAPAQARQMMLESAVRNESSLLVDPRELERSGPSYMYDTLLSIQAEFPGQSLVLVLGMDAFAGLERWHRWNELPGLTHFLVLHRPGYELQLPAGLIRSGLFRIGDYKDVFDRYTSGSVVFHAVSQLEISSTGIREILARSGNPRFLLPESVLEIIREQGLYTGNP